jgi:hypothetical protein
MPNDVETGAWAWIRARLWLLGVLIVLVAVWMAWSWYRMRAEAKRREGAVMRASQNTGEAIEKAEEVRIAALMEAAAHAKAAAALKEKSVAAANAIEQRGFPGVAELVRGWNGE